MNMGQTTILLVEDEAINAIVGKKTLEKYGYNVVISNSGEKAVELVKKYPGIDLILMDIDLGSGIDGTEAAEEILKNNDLPLVFLSSHTEPEVVEKTEGITSYGYIVKNSGETVLIASIKMAFRLFAEKEIVKLHQRELEASTEALKASESAVRNRLKAITDPESDIGELELADIIDVPQLQAMMDKLYQLTGILSAILDLSGNILVAVGWQDICTKFHRCNPETLKNCLESDTVLSQGVKPGEFKLYKCKNNLWDMVTPIEIYGTHMGNVFFGQFFFEDEVPEKELFINQARQFGFDEADYLAALDRVPRLSRNSVEAAMEFIARLTDLISTMSFRTIELARINTEQKKTEEILREGESYIRSIFRAAPVGIGVVVDRLIVQANDRICELTGYARDELIGQSSRILYPSDQEYEFVGNEKYRQIQEKGTGTVETLWQGKDGTIIQVLLSSTPLDMANLKKGVTFTALDITERKLNEELIKSKSEDIAAAMEELEGTNEELIAAMEELEAVNEELISTNEELQSKEELYRNLFENHTAVKLMIDPESEKIIDANNAAAEFYGWSREHMRTMRIYEVNTLPAEELRKEIEKARSLKRIYFEFRHRLADGSIKDVEVYSCGINVNGKTILHSIIHDISAKKIAEDRLNKLMAEKEILLNETHQRDE